MSGLPRQLPNALSLLRLLAAPITGLMIWQERFVSALGLFAVAGLSDALDGWLAKHYGLASRIGAWLDPAADKLLMLISFAFLALAGAIPWWLAWVVVGRDLAIVAGVVSAKLLRAPLEVKPLRLGKLSTLVQVVFVLLVLLTLALGRPAPVAVDIGIAAVTLLAASSLLAYAAIWLRAIGRRGD